MAKLGVNIDHVATLRQARQGSEPDPVWAAVEAQLGGADAIVLHVREDRRHIQDRDARLIRETIAIKYNLEMSATDAMIDLALELRADQATLVPERREEVTTEGGLDVIGHRDRLRGVVDRLHEAGIVVNLFIDPVADQVEASKDIGADAVELHTGAYANTRSSKDEDLEYGHLKEAGRLARDLGLVLHVGHGLNYTNTRRLLSIVGVEEFNIGHSIVSRAVFVGLREAVRQMKLLIDQGSDRNFETSKRI